MKIQLTPGQSKKLINDGWDIKQGGRILLLLKQDFHGKAYKEVCQCTEITEDVLEVELFYVGVKIEKYEETT